MSYACPWLDVIPVVERDEAREGGAETGTLADVVTRYGAWADHDVTVCGSPAMIRATVSVIVSSSPSSRRGWGRGGRLARAAGVIRR